MKNNSKIIKSLKLGFLLVMFISAGFIFQFCQKDTDEFDTDIKVPQEYAQIGALHNEGLNYVFKAIREKTLESIEESNGTLKSSKDLNYADIIEESVVDFCIGHPKMSESPEAFRANMLEYQQSKMSMNRKAGELDDMSPKQQVYSGLILNTLKNRYSKGNVGKLKSNLNEIARKASKELSDEEMKAVYAGISTAYSSYQYWQKNYKKWYFALNFPEILEKYNEDQLNQLQISDLKTGRKSGNDWIPDWLKQAWTPVENWWIDGWSEENTEWMWNALEEMAEEDVKGALVSARYAPALIVEIATVRSAVEGAEQLYDKIN